MREFVRFLFSGNDIHKIVMPLQVDDVLPSAAPLAVFPPTGAMKLTFRLYDPGPAQIRPLLPGTMRFLVDHASPGIMPDPPAVAVTDAAYDSWKTIGRILITVEDKTVSDELSKLAPNLPVKPNRLWYGPVQLPKNFLFETLLQKLPKGVLNPPVGPSIRPNNPNWGKYAISEFLAGRYAPPLRLGANATLDDVACCTMPVVVVPPDGNIELFVSMALAQPPQDGRDDEFDNASPLSRNDPSHPRNGLISAREVYRQLRSNMVAEPSSNALRDAILADWPQAPRFFPITFTRTWELTPNCSLHFNRQIARIQSGATILHEQPLPAHGVLFLRQEPANPLPPPPNITISLSAGDMKWLLGGGTSWRERGETAPVAFDLGAVPRPHVALRLPMARAIFSDTTRPAPGGPRCTYLSLRRTVRAWVDNRIAGGRLNYGVGATSALTKGIIRRAFAGTPASANSISDNAPDPFGDPLLAATLEPILAAFFPDNAPQQAMPGAPANPTIYNEGLVAYRIWQSMLALFENNPTKRNFNDSHIGRGGPGAVVSLGLATFHVDPARNPGETDAAYFDRIVDLMLGGLEPGAPLQFWNLDRDFEEMRSRSTGGAIASYGHSPLFVDYVRDAAGDITGIRILDQQGESDEPFVGAPGARLLTWSGNPEQIWIAANWEE